MVATSTVITVTELTTAIKNQLESRFPIVKVEGEITNGKIHSSGHYYFDLKDSQAKIGAVMFKAHYLQLNKPPREGDRIIVTGSLSVYPLHGKYQILVKRIEYQGTGELLLKFEALKQKLLHLGWFDPSHKQPLPKFPQRIGVVTSPTGAVIRDILQILNRRLERYHLILNPVRVQGAEAACEIAQAIEQFNHYRLADILIVGRGGGSLEDLWPFNEEIVVKAIFQSKIPIISAVGHETDVTLADFVADLRAPTPSAAAEILSEEQYRCRERFSTLQRHLSQTLFLQIQRVKAELERFICHPLMATSYALISQPLQSLDEMKTTLDLLIRQELINRRSRLLTCKKEAYALKPSAQIIFFRHHLSQLEKNLLASLQNSLKTKRERLREIFLRLSALNPKQVLKRGYAILFALNENSVIVSSRDMYPGQHVRVLLSDGESTLTVNHE